MCHTVFPQLNQFGKSFFDNGFRIPGSEDSSPLAFGKTSPVSFSTRATLVYDPKADKKVQTVWDDAQIHLSGLLTKNDAFYMHLHAFEMSRGGDFYEIWAQHSFGGKSPLNIRIGQFVLPLAFTPELQRLTWGEYLAYGQRVGFNDFSLANPQTGITASWGKPNNGLRLDVAFTQPRRHFENGGGEDSNLLFTSPTFSNVFTKVQYQAERVRVGIFHDSGKTNLFTTVSDGEGSSSISKSTDSYTRSGIDAEAQLGKFRLYGQLLAGTHSNPLSNGERGSMNGGFIGLDYAMGKKCMIYLRYDKAQTRTSDGLSTQLGPLFGFTHLLKPNWQAQLEYQHMGSDENLLVFSNRIAF